MSNRNHTRCFHGQSVGVPPAVLGTIHYQAKPESGPSLGSLILVTALEA